MSQTKCVQVAEAGDHAGGAAARAAGGGVADAGAADADVAGGSVAGGGVAYMQVFQVEVLQVEMLQMQVLQMQVFQVQVLQVEVLHMQVFQVVCCSRSVSDAAYCSPVDDINDSPLLYWPLTNSLGVCPYLYIVYVSVYAHLNICLSAYTNISVYCRIICKQFYFEFCCQASR